MLRIRCLLACMLAVLALAGRGVPLRRVDIGDGLPHNVVKCFAEDGKGYLWIGTFDGLARYDGRHMQVLRPVEGDSCSLPGAHIEALLPDGEALLVGTDRGLYRIGPDGRGCRVRWREGGSPVTNYISQLLRTDAAVYALTASGAMLMRRHGEEALTRVGDYAPHHVLAVEALGGGCLLVLTDVALMVVDEATHRTLHMVPVEGLAPNWNSMHYSCERRQVVVGSGLGYASRAYEVGEDGSLVPSALAVPPNLKDALYHRGRWYFATDGEGLAVATEEGLQRLTPENSDIPSHAIHALYVDSKDNLWMGTYRSGLCVAVRGDEAFTRYGIHNGRLSRDAVAAVYAWGAKVCVGTDGGGLHIIDTSDGSLQVVDAESSPLPSNHIYQMRGCGDTLYVRVYEREVYGQPLSGSDVYACSLADGRVVPYDGPVAWHAADTLVDSYGNRWYASEGQLCVWLSATGHRAAFVETEALPRTSYCQGAAFQRGDTLYFGTTSGLLQLDAREALAAIGTAPVYLDGVTVWDDGSYIALGGTAEASVTLPPEHNFITIHFTSPQLAPMAAQRVRYRLQGVDDQWREGDDLTEAVYTAIRPGNYTFTVMAADGAGRWSTTPAVLHVCLLPPWYATWWATVLWGALACCSVGWGVWLYLRQQRRRMAAQQQEQERRREIEHLHHRQELEREAHRDKLNLLTNITHELRTPLFVLSATLEELQGTAGRGKLLPATLTTMHRHVYRMGQLVDNILAAQYDRLHTLALRAVTTDVVALCRRLTPDYQALCQQKSIAYAFYAELATLTAMVDEEKVELVLSNLLSNAFKYTPEQGTVTLHLTAPDATHYRFIISDNGIGIAEEELPRVFERHYRGKNSTEAMGNGLGLAFVKQLVELCGGDIRISSVPMKGTQVEVTLPLMPPVAEGAVDTDEDTRQEPPAVANPTAVYTILVIDDEPEIRRLMQQQLGMHYRIATAADGEAALVVARDMMPDLIICDMMMPQMDGLALLALLKQDKTLQHIPVIMFSAKHREEEQIAAFQAGAAAYLTKPVSMKMLRARIEQFVSRPAATIHKSMQSTAEEYGRELKEQGVEAKEDERFIARCKEVIDAHLTDERLCVEFLAEQMHMSHSALYKRVKAITGQSAANLIIDYRIFRAVEMLRQGETNITLVAERCGFGDVRAFRSAFKNRLGTTPKKYISGE